MDIKKIEHNIEEAACLLKALSNEKRLLIACALHEKERCVGELEALVGLSQSALSQHLARLRRDGLVQTRREAQTIYYTLKDETVKCVLECLHGVFEGK
ncbi:MAG: winged helix-turn-helix transcriptional regulator [Alphaproteobacteria bacterium]|nr:winged helix-turn-helix transcriptional regulator [Alphaproteobacteria bacterium]